MRLETQILSGLLNDITYSRKVISFLEEDYFKERSEQIVLDEIVQFFSKYNEPPSKEILNIQVAQRADVSDTILSQAIDTITELSSEKVNTNWLIENTEQFCKKMSVYNAVLASIKIIDGTNEKLTQDAIPDLMTKALAVSFDASVGHDYIIDAENRWDFYHKKENKIPFDLKMLNKIMAGGMSRKSLYCVASQSGAGKSLLMCHVAASTLRLGLNVLYITMEMAEERIAERIDANLMRVDIASLSEMSKDIFTTKIDKIKAKTHGRLFIKEYPTGSAHVGHFRALVEELKVKQAFHADLIIVDYMGICASSRMKMGGVVNTYSYVKAIAEELRGFAVEQDVPLFTGAQLNRSGYENTDVSMANTAESMGIVMTLDVFFALIRTDELDDQNSIMVTQLKNRYSDPNINKRFLLGVNRPRMTFYDLEDSAQSQILPEAVNKTFPPRKPEEHDTPVFDRSKKPLDTGGFIF